MSQIIETPSGIALACEDRGEQQIDQDLKRLDSDLFLTKEVHRPTGAWFYTVYQRIGNAVPPLHILYWTSDRTRTGEPLPLSSGLFYEVESRKQYAGRNLVQEADAENERIVAKAEAEHDAELEEEILRYHKRRLRLGSGQNQRRFFEFDKTGKT